MLQNLVQEKYSMQTQAHGHYLETLKVPVLFDCMFCSSLHIGCNPSVHTHTPSPVTQMVIWCRTNMNKFNLKSGSQLPGYPSYTANLLWEWHCGSVADICTRNQVPSQAKHVWWSLCQKKGSMQIQQSNIEWYQILRHVECYAKIVYPKEQKGHKWNRMFCSMR